MKKTTVCALRMYSVHVEGVLVCFVGTESWQRFLFLPPAATLDGEKSLIGNTPERFTGKQV